jgi:hypothetical protein
MSPASLQASDFTGGITPKEWKSPDGKSVYVANLETEDISFLGVDKNGKLARQGFLAVGVTNNTPDPARAAWAPTCLHRRRSRPVGSSLPAYADDPPIPGKTTVGFDAQSPAASATGWPSGWRQWNVATARLAG